MVKACSLSHIALGVKDTKRSFKFYDKVFGIIKICNQKRVDPGADAGFTRHHRVRRKRAAHPKNRRYRAFGFRLVDPKDIDAAADTVRKPVKDFEQKPVLFRRT